MVTVTHMVWGILGLHDCAWKREASAVMPHPGPVGIVLVPFQESKS